MKAHGWFAELYEETRDSFEYKLKSLELELTEKILAAMKARGMSRSDLAERLGTSKAAVSKLLNDGSNITVKRLLKISMALGCDLNIDLNPPSEKQSGCRINTPCPEENEASANIPRSR
jgi:transcriptional regulator with XRE-family HTH domain